MAVYLLIGGAVFMGLEAQAEQNRMSDTRTTRENLINNLTVNFNTTRDQIEGIFDAFTTACEAGLLLNDTAPLWEFGRAVFFAISVVTTIGEPIYTCTHACH